MKTVVICGGGIIGCSIAYYLTKLDNDFARVIIVERNEIAGHASGKAGGFLGTIGSQTFFGLLLSKDILVSSKKIPLLWSLSTAFNLHET